MKNALHLTRHDRKFIGKGKKKHIVSQISKYRKRITEETVIRFHMAYVKE